VALEAFSAAVNEWLDGGRVSVALLVKLCMLQMCRRHQGYMVLVTVVSDRWVAVQKGAAAVIKAPGALRIHNCGNRLNQSSQHVGGLSALPFALGRSGVTAKNALLPFVIRLLLMLP
jgi:hypothetical protein